MDDFLLLGNRIDAAWRDLDYSEEKFPALAAEHLRKAKMPSKVTAWDVLEWGLKQTQLPRQKDVHSMFGDPAVTLFTAPKFHIDVYFWFEGTTAIHQHAFCGAFQVLHGSSIHSWYEFDRKESVNVFTEIGDIKLKVCELLEKSDVQEILPGRQYIHGLFHLDSPSATICVRTDKSPLYAPQYNYQKPSIATDPFYEEETQTKKIQMIAAMLRAKRPDADEQIKRLIAESDFQTTFSILNFLSRAIATTQIDQLFELSSSRDRFEAFLRAARDRHGKKVDVLSKVFAHNDKLGEILNRRAVVTDPEHRFFFALLLNVDGKEQIFSLIRQRFPKVEPKEKVLDWVFDLSQTRVVGSRHQNALGIDPFDDLDLMIFEYLLDGQSNADIRKMIETEYPPEKLKPIKKELPQRLSKIKNAVIFGPLFE